MPERADSLGAIGLRLDGLSGPRVRGAAWIGLLALIVALTASLDRRLTEMPNRADARQNLVAAYNLAYHGTISLSTDRAEPEASNYREPLPILFLAAHIALHPALKSGLTPESINEAPAVLAVKRHNLLWAFFCLLGVALLTSTVIRPRAAGLIAAAVAVLLTYEFLLDRASIIDRMMSEIQAAALLVWASFALTRALQSGRPAWFVAIGALLGALALTKAFFLYVGIGLIAALLPFWIWRPAWSRRRTLGLIALMAASMAAIMAPWLIRNWIQFDSLEITQRGGAVLMIRAHKNQMNDVEYAGAFYHYAPSLLKPVLGHLLGFSREDLEEGGRLQRMNRSRSTFAERDLAAERAGRPQDAISFYRAARAERIRLRNHYKEQGVDNPALLGGRALRDEALRLILSDPMQHLKATVLFMWRGTYFLALPLIVMAVFGLLRRNAEITGVSLLTAGAALFLALATHFIPRYASPMIPMMIIAYALLMTSLLAKSRLAQHRKPLLLAARQSSPALDLRDAGGQVGAGSGSGP